MADEAEKLIGRGFLPVSFLKEVAEPLCARAHSGYHRVLVLKLINSAGCAIFWKPHGSAAHISETRRHPDFVHRRGHDQRNQDYPDVL